MKPSAHLTIPLLLAIATGSVAAPRVPIGEDCGTYVRHDPGGDYTNPTDREGLTVVEQYHFTPEVERLVRGATGSLGADIGYTLDHFPNHHRALAAMSKLALRDKTPKPYGAHYSIGCYFDRALRFRPDDARVHALLGGYLLGLGQSDAALEQLQEAVRLEPNNATTHYNLGLLYLKRKDYQQARASAHQAYGLGFPLPGLKNQLTAAGQWREAE